MDEREDGGDVYWSLPTGIFSVWKLMMQKEKVAVDYCLYTNFFFWKSKRLYCCIFPPSIINTLKRPKRIKWKQMWKGTYCEGFLQFYYVLIWKVLEINPSLVFKEMTNIRHNSDGYCEVLKLLSRHFRNKENDLECVCFVIFQHWQLAEVEWISEQWCWIYYRCDKLMGFGLK